MILQLINVVMGLVVVYMVFSTLSSSILELLETYLKKRGKLLELGVHEILSRVLGKGNTVDSKQLLQAFYEHPQIYSLYRGAYKNAGRNLPSYIPTERFVAAVMSLAESPDENIRASFTQIQNAITEMGRFKPSDLEPIPVQIGRYFDQNMERVSGWYRRHARLALIILGFVLAAAGNIDTFTMVKTLSGDPEFRDQLIEKALDDTTGDRLKTMQMPADTPAEAGQSSEIVLAQQFAVVAELGLPIGWDYTETCAVFGRYCDESAQVPPDADTAPSALSWRQKLSNMGATSWALLVFVLGNWLFWQKLLGVALTAVAVSFGAPFWFDLLNNLGSLRTALQPKTESPEKPEPK